MSNKLTGYIYAPDAIQGKSAYEIAVMNGFDGTEEEWLDSLTDEAVSRAEEVIKSTKESAVSEINSSAEEVKEYTENALTVIGEKVTEAETAEAKASVSAGKALESEIKAKTSEENAKLSENNAKDSETKAKTSENNAKSSENSAKTSETNAKTSENNAKSAETSAKNSADTATSAKNTAESAATSASNSANSAAKSSTEATESANSAEGYAIEANLSASYALSAEEQAKMALSKTETARDEAEAAASVAKSTAEIAANEVKKVCASAIPNTASGSVVSLTDISPIEHTLRVKARSKNSIPYPFYDTTKTTEGITYTDNGDGTVTANGTSTGIADFILAYDFPVKKGMIISGAPEGTNDDTFEIQVYKDGKNVVQSYGAMAIATTDFVGTARIRIRSGYTANNLVFKPQLAEFASPYTPYIDVSKAKLIKSGKNFAQINSVSAPFTDIVTIFEGEISGNFVLSCDISTLGDFTSESATLFRCTLKDGTTIFSTSVKYLEPVRISGVLTKVELVHWSYAKSGSVNNIQLEPGTVPTEFEPHKEPVPPYTINADGTVEGVTSLHPTTTLVPDTEGVVIDAEYNVDTKKYVDNQIDKKIAELMALVLEN